ncbi:hypothetical protein [Arcobacter sp. s6]|jgi:hypothetical protein|uniref:hypothetical protein n=1 Tax=Arcobacter sp. s6 TaxID=3230363 RepID=UPI0034A03E44
MNISQQFAPPFKLVGSFFVSAMFILFISIILLFNFDINSLHTQNTFVLSWVHLFLLGFVMMSIFASMAQLLPVVLEVEHFSIDLYYVVNPLLFLGTVIIFFGFYKYPILLSYGGVIVFISFFIFLLESFLTIKKVEKLNFLSSTVLVANVFLLLGLIVAIILSFVYSGNLDLDIKALMLSHIYLVFVGYLGITIISMSYILIPMFWLSHSFNNIYLKLAFYSISVGVVFVVLSQIFKFLIFEYFGYSLVLIGFILFIYQLYLIFKTKVRKQKDIYYKYIVFSIVNFVLALILVCIYYIFLNDYILIIAGFIFLLGFLIPIITAHLYKIIPFLVWFHRFAPLVGKEKVPMLADMVPIKSSDFGFVFYLIGFVLCLIAFSFSSDILFKSAISFLFIGTSFIIKDVFYIINFKG